MKYTFTLVIIVLVMVVGAYYFLSREAEAPQLPKTDEAPVVVEEKPETPQESTTTPVTTPEKKTETVIGTSVQGRAITAYHFGEGEKDVLFIGGIHGGYSWNTSLVAYALVDHLKANPQSVPKNVRVTVIPVLNPDGLFAVTKKEGRFKASDMPALQEATVQGRFNANAVDLNRNFDCDWKKEGTWQNKTVSGGSAAFSEPESKAVKAFVEDLDPEAVIVYYSAAGGVYASNCHNGVLPETRALMNTYARASGYGAHDSFDFYEITGDMVNWLAKEGIPGISVLLTTHSDVEWEKNWKGIEAVLREYSK